jgi:hypothetical protein
VSRARLVGLCLAAWLSAATFASAQTGDAKLAVTVVDPTGGVLPTATVTVTGAEPATQKTSVKPVVASDKGVATFDHLAAGLYTIQGEFTQFNPSILKDVRLKAGDNARTIVLTLKQVTESVTVTEDRQSAAADRSAVGFGTTVSTDQVQALSDDPTELQRQIQDMAGPDAVIRVDGFEGAPLPPKSQIKAIHITRDQFAAENHYAGGVFIDIVTQPGIGPPHGGVNANDENWNLDGRNPLLATKTPMNTQYMNYNYGQSLLKNRADFTLNINENTSYTTPAIIATGPTGPISQVTGLHAPTTFLGGNLGINFALSPDQTLKVWLQSNKNTSDDQGVGGMSALDHAYSTTSTQQSLRLQEAGPLGRRFFINTRVLVTANGTSNDSVTNAPTVVVEGNETLGGAQLAGGTQQKNALVQSDIDYIRGISTIRFGTQLQSTWYHTNTDSNYLGTYSYLNWAAYAANTPALFTQNIGDPTIGYSYFEGGVYAQDDIRVKKSLTISAGVRYELQNHSTDHNNVAPRVGLTWAPFKGGATTVRASAGIFYDWISNSTYETSLRDDGIRQQQLNIVDPTFGEISADQGTIPATGIDLLGPNLQLARTLRFSVAISQNLGKRVNIGVVFAHNRAVNQLSGVNLNAPVDGVLPNPAFTTIMQAQSDATTLSYNIQTNLSISFAPPSPALNKARFNWTRGGVYVYDRYGHANTDALGAFTPSPTGTLTTEWGPASNDIRNYVNVSVYSNALKNLNVNLFFNSQSGAPYNEILNTEDPNDFLFDLRPAGVGRNTLRQPSQWDLSGSFSYTFGFHKRSTDNVPGMVGFNFNNGQISAQTFAADPNRFHVNIGVYVTNLTNHANYTGYSGIIGTPYFNNGPGSLAPAVGDMRTVRFLANFRF